MKNDYNGWTNKQTWNINLTYGEIFANMCEEENFEDAQHLADAFESLVDELEYSILRDGSLAQQAVGEYLDRVNWEEIAAHYIEDFDLFKKEDSEEDIQGLRELLAEAE